MRIDTAKHEGTSASRPARSRARIWFLLLAFIACPPLRPEAATGPQTTGATTKEPVTLPPTPAGRQFAEWLQAFNTGDAGEIRSFISKHFEEAALRRIPAEERALMDLVLYGTTRGVVPYHIDWSTDPEIAVLARANLTEELARIDLEVGSDPLHRIKKFHFTLTGRPADNAPLEKLTEAQTLEGLEAYLNKLVAANAFSGAVLVARDGKPIFQEAYGLANKKSNLPNRLGTKFNIGSMDKMFTALAIAQLAEAGKLSFDDTIGKYLHDYPNKAAAETVTIHQLLTHTSGMGDYFGPKFEETKASLKSVKDYFPLFARNRLSSAPGNKWGYSNAGYIVLGAIIEQVSGQSYFDYVKEHISRPAGMSDTDFYETDGDTPNLAVGYTNMDPSGRPDLFSRTENTPMLPVKGGPAGGGYSTVEDLLKFDVALRTHKLLNPKFTGLVLTGKVERDDEWGGKYAYGFAEDMINGKRIVGYTAGYPGVNGGLDLYPDLGYTVVVLSNYDPPSAQRVAYRLREMITRKQ
jgi:CubicO group peptidase (beta-lactamase class C family)